MFGPDTDDCTANNRIALVIKTFPAVIDAIYRVKPDAIGEYKRVPFFTIRPSVRVNV